MPPFRNLTVFLRLPDARPIDVVDREIAEELSFHIAMRTRDNLARGMTAEQAERDARRQFGDRFKIQKACRTILIGDRIMLQRVQTARLVVLLAAVVFSAFLSHLRQREAEAALASMQAAVEHIQAEAAKNAESSAELITQTQPPIVIKTWPETGAVDVDTSLTEIRVTYSKKMMDRSWSWSTMDGYAAPETTGEPRYESDGKTCVLPVTLEPGTTYAFWLNSKNFRNFKDRSGQPATPFFLEFTTRE